MKKWLVALLSGVLILIVALYVFIPNVIKLSAGTSISATGSGIHRMLLNNENLARWWPGKKSNDGFYLNDYAYKIANNNITLLQVSINGQSRSVTTSLFLISLLTDSTQLEWVGSVPTSYNPFKRFFGYLDAKKINRDMNTILNKMKLFYSNANNIYGLEIRKAFVTDSFLISTSATSKGYPTNQFIYDLIDQLRTYALSQSAKESGYPMLNVGTTDSVNFDVRVAIPTNKLLPSSGNIEQKRMLGRGNILVAEVKGGIEETSRAMREIQHYAEDYKRKAPAIHFYSLVTDRLKEPDSSKWLTKIYFPVM